MRKFGFFVHPLDMRDVVRIAPQAEGKRRPLVEKILEWIMFLLFFYNYQNF